MRVNAASLIALALERVGTNAGRSSLSSQSNQEARLRTSLSPRSTLPATARVHEAHRDGGLALPPTHREGVGLPNAISAIHDTAASGSHLFYSAVLDAFQQFDAPAQQQEIVNAVTHALGSNALVLRSMSNFQLAQLGAAFEGHGAIAAAAAVRDEQQRLNQEINEGFRLLVEHRPAAMTYEQLQHFHDAVERFGAHAGLLSQINSAMLAMQPG